MDGGGSTKSNEEREAEKSMDGYLKTQGLHRKKIAKDGSCLFRAVAEQVLHNQGRHTEVRAKCVEFLKENRGSYEAFIEGDFEDYLLKLQDPQQWVGEVEINALAVIYKRDFFIFQEPGKPAVNITDNNFKDTVQLCFLNGNHYDSVYAVSHIQAAALCQSILYELLYDGVFGVERGALGSCQRSSRPADLLSDDAMNACVSSDDSDLEAGEPLWVENGANTPARPNNQRGRGRGRLLPERVRRSLNPTLLRNVEYDVWHKSKRAQQKMDYCIAAGMQFTVGDRCQVRLEGRSHSAVIKEVSPASGPVSVYLEELGSRKQVPLWSLRPPSEENSWSTVVNRGDKKLSNGHGEWEERSRGRGRGRNVASASSSSVSPATAPGASGRVQKQHSWPPQATVEEQAGAKGVRKSLSSVDPHFGLTERQRSAREVEEKNTALVEIQLRDENSFPVLGGDAGRRKGGDKRWCSTTTAKSPVDDVGAPSPSAGQRPKSSTPPLGPPAAAPPRPSLPAAAPPANCQSSLPPPAAPSIKPPSAGGAVPPPLPPAATLSPALPAASHRSSSPPPPSSLPAPTFIAPIAPSPAAALGFLPRSSPPLSSFPRSPSPASFASFSSPPVQQAPPPPVQQAPPPQSSSVHPPMTRPPLTHGGSLQMQSEAPPPQALWPPHPQGQHQYLSQSEAVQSSQPADGGCYPPAPQATGPSPVQLHSPHPSPSHPSLQYQAQAPHPEVHAPSHPPHPQLQSAAPPHHQSIPGAVPLQQLSQLYQDPLYPGFPRGEGGDVAPTPLFSSSKSGNDLPRDLNILKFFFNLGIKAYSMPMCPPYIYLLPLQQAHTLQPKLPSPSCSPTPHYPPSSHQEAYPHPQHDPPAPLPEPPEPHFNQATTYPFAQPQAHRMPSPSWQQPQMPPHSSTSYQVGYPHPGSSYQAAPPMSQGYQRSQGQPVYPQYPPPSSMGYLSPSAHEELPMEQRQPSPSAANVANANNNNKAGFGLKEAGDGLTRAVLLVDPPFNNTPIITLVSKPDVKDVSMATMNPRSSPGSPSPYDLNVSVDNRRPRGCRSYQRPHHPANAYVQLGPPEPGQLGYMSTASVSCSTEDQWEEAGFRPATSNPRGLRKNPRGGRGRGGYDPARGGPRRRHGGDDGVDSSYIQYSPSHRGRGRERGY